MQYYLLNIRNCRKFFRQRIKMGKVAGKILFISVKRTFKIRLQPPTRAGVKGEMGGFFFYPSCESHRNNRGFSAGLEKRLLSISLHRFFTSHRSFFCGWLTNQVHNHYKFSVNYPSPLASFFNFPNQSRDVIKNSF